MIAAASPPVCRTPPNIELFKLTKRFGTFTALENVSLKLKPGSFHVLLGENGAGKSTLVKAMMGYHRADEGSVIIDAREVVMANPKDAHAHGIGMVYQHFTLVPNFTVAENLVLSRDHLPALIDWKAERAAIDTFMATMPFKLPLDRPVASLAAGEKQKLEILKQLYLERTVIILDEPTSVLTQNEADDILGLLKKMTVEGRLSILMISHKFREVMAFGDEITVLRKGRFAGNGLVKDLTPAQMADMMMGGAHVTASLARGDSAPGEIRLAGEHLTANDDTGVGAVNGVSFQVRSGEILGVAGVSGNGQKQLVEVLAGQRPATGGKVLVDGTAYHATRKESLKHKVHILPEEPLKNACVGDMSVADNLGFRRYDQPPNTWLKWLVKRSALRVTAAELVKQFAIKTTGVDAPIASLSGGNVQRGVLAREVNDEVRVLIVANPCFGLDFKAVAEIRSRIMQARNRGVAVLLVSEDLDELFELADRLVVMSGGKFVHEALPSQTNPAELGGHMAGHH